ncbi:unnamed protein product [Brachionus calyciflorus]|uniref:Uncharacterized protein n=1 Tax=Brachionus calyciflorus TaxID=104777 RepID=A0A813NR24_9BILA|nr:unnamed protein product [Brachionus calyciflorus]
MRNLKFRLNYIIYCYLIISCRIGDFVLLSQSVTSTKNANYYRTQVICSCLMSEMEEFQNLSCPTPYKLDILHGFLFDSGEIDGVSSNCTSNIQNVKVIKTITNDLQQFCSTNSQCHITKSFLINSKGDYTKIDCLSTSIIWTCVASISKSTSNSSYNFTYFFYIITLIFSSSCIIVGSLFIIRRRRKNQMRARQNQLPNTNGTGSGNDNNIWTTSSFGPPSYENIYDSSLPIVNSIPPPYEIVKNKKEAEIISARSDDTSNNPPGREINEHLMSATIDERNSNNSVNIQYRNRSEPSSVFVKRISQLDLLNINANSNSENKNYSA